MRIEKIEVLDGAEEPISLAEAKSWCNYALEQTEQDGNFLKVIKAVRVFMENYLNMALIPQRVTVVTTREDETHLRLPKPPHTSIISVSKLHNGVESAFTDYEVGGGEYLYIRPAWIGTLSEGWYRFYYRVVYEAGGEEIDHDIKLAMLKMIKSIYEDRGNFVKGVVISRLMENGLDLVAHKRQYVEL